MFVILTLLLGNSLSRLNSQSETSPDACSLVSKVDFSGAPLPSVISPDWFCPDISINTVIRKKKSQDSPLMCCLCPSENCFPFQSEFTFVFGKKMHRKCLRPAIEARQQQFVRCYQITMCKFPARRSDTDPGFVPDGEMYENVNDATCS